MPKAAEPTVIKALLTFNHTMSHNQSIGFFSLSNVYSRDYKFSTEEKKYGGLYCQKSSSLYSILLSISYCFEKG